MLELMKAGLFPYFQDNSGDTRSQENPRFAHIYYFPTEEEKVSKTTFPYDRFSEGCCKINFLSSHCTCSDIPVLSFHNTQASLLLQQYSSQIMKKKNHLFIILYMNIVAIKL